MASIFTSLFLLLAVGVLFTHCSPQEQLQGKLETMDGSTCVWFELRKSGRGNVFVTACHCKDADGHRHSYSCEYDGPMEDCEIYQSNPKDFYNRVATTLQNEHSNPCEPTSISVSQCPDVMLQKSEGSDLPPLCVPEPKDEL